MVEIKKSATVNPGTVNDLLLNCFKYPFVLTLHYKEMKIEPEQESNIDWFPNLHNWVSLEHSATINENDFTRKK